MIALKETTKWEDPIPNHTYLVDGDKIHAYIKEGEAEPHYFKSPMRFERRYRSFIEVQNPFVMQTPSSVIKVTGSRGDTYEIDTVEKTCTCQGFKWKGNCKHLKEYVK